MSIVCKIEQLDDPLRRIILQELHVKKTQPKSKNPKMQKCSYQQQPKEVITYRIYGLDDSIYMPFAFANTTLRLSRPPRESYPSIRTKFVGSLREKQVEVRQEAIQLLNKNGSLLLALHVGFEKSVLSLELACKIKLRTMIVVHRILLIHQWIESIHKYCDGKATACTFDKYDDDSDFLVLNVLNIPKLTEAQLQSFGFIIIDECHLISTEHFSKSLQHLTPRYLVGLSATPYRNDGMDKIMDLYFGTERITRKLQIEHVVYKIQTSFVPPIIQMRNGQLDWNHIIEAQSNHPSRNDMIMRLVDLYPDRHILILCKRKEQGNHLLKVLTERQHHVTRLMGTDKSFDKNARIVVATINKAGVGFSHDVLDTLILAADVEEYYIQYLGRITRRPDVKPMIFDIIDQNPTLQRHFQTRRKVYKEIGGTIFDFKKEYPDFKII